MPTRKNSTPKERTKTIPKVLEYLALTPASKWDLATALSKSYSNIHSTVNKLLKQKLIEVSGKRKADKNPKIEVEDYNVTLRGLTVALGSPRLWEKMDEIAKHHEDKLFLFQIWNNFSHEEKELLMKLFQTLFSRGDFSLQKLALERVHYIGPPERIRDPPLYQISSEDLKGYIEDFFFFSTGPVNTILKRNSKVRKHMLARYSESVKIHKSAIKELECEIAELKSLEK